MFGQGNSVLIAENRHNITSCPNFLGSRLGHLAGAERKNIRMVTPSHARVGIDFGTTNSSIGLGTGDSNVELVRFAHSGGVTEAFRSLLYLEQFKNLGRSSIQSWTGPAAIEQYLLAENKGRLIQSLKSHLASRSLTSTEVFGRRYTIKDLIARILTDLREYAERQFGRPIRSAVVGRPVRFVGAETGADNLYALSRMRKAFQKAGFESVDFEMEPVAAAFHYESTLDHDELILIGDFGGGTSDFSLLRLGPDIRKRGRLPGDFLGNSGGEWRAIASTLKSCAIWFRRG